MCINLAGKYNGNRTRKRPRQKWRDNNTRISEQSLEPTFMLFGFEILHIYVVVVVVVVVPIPVAERSKARVYSRSLAEIAGSNPAGGMECCKVEVAATGQPLVHRSPTDCVASLCVICKTPRMRRPWPALGCCTRVVVVVVTVLFPLLARISTIPHIFAYSFLRVPVHPGVCLSSSKYRQHRTHPLREMRGPQCLVRRSNNVFTCKYICV